MGKSCLISCVFLITLPLIGWTQEATKTLEALIGKRLPADFPIGHVMGSGKNVTLSEFENRLLILDFWHTGCASCIAAFPKMERLQNMFPDQVAILLVNLMQTEDKIKEHIRNTSARGLSGLSAALKNTTLPIVLASEEMKNRIPHMGFPTHAWVDGSGELVLYGSQANTHEKKVREFLGGNEITFIHTSATGKFYDFTIPLFFDPNITIRNEKLYMSAFSDFQYGLSGYPQRKSGIVDPQAETIRMTFVNDELLSLIYTAAETNLERAGWKELVFSPNSMEGRQYLDVFRLFVKDTLTYTKYFKSREKSGEIIDEDFVTSGYCYEQIVPIGTKDLKRKEWMFEDLNRAMSETTKSKVEIVYESLVCYELKSLESSCLHQPGAGRKSDITLRSLLFDFFGNKQINERPYVFCEDMPLLDKEFHMSSGTEPHTISDLISLLLDVGVEMVVSERTLPVLQVTDMIDPHQSGQ